MTHAILHPELRDGQEQGPRKIFAGHFGLFLSNLIWKNQTSACRNQGL